ncbi:hypothetical protein EVAR_12910_1 [Eumeta japonica]|uniref:Uncharacterized protein n=1 Tax=Eumeta variegata TaxID=151549 RepID=A0A4C1TVT1_EUMVA|nr:hypothetical protein EVAR_12910_1 [Eumeta japonica]
MGRRRGVGAARVNGRVGAAGQNASPRAPAAPQRRVVSARALAVSKTLYIIVRDDRTPFGHRRLQNFSIATGPSELNTAVIARAGHSRAICVLAQSVGSFTSIPAHSALRRIFYPCPRDRQRADVSSETKGPVTAISIVAVETKLVASRRERLTVWEYRGVVIKSSTLQNRFVTGHRCDVPPGARPGRCGAAARYRLFTNRSILLASAGRRAARSRTRLRNNRVKANSAPAMGVP